MATQIRRRLQAYGYSCLVSVPKQWLALHGLGAGDEINFKITNDGFLILKRAEAEDATAANITFA